jgi:carboxypeptidase Q
MFIMQHRTLALAFILTAVVTLPFAAEERIDSEINARIRQEGLQNSQVMRTLHHLTDVYGPRVTGSPSLKAAGEWSIKQMEAWGLTNGRMEPWNWGHPGWTNELAWGAITSPVKDSLILEVLAWTPGTNGPVKAQAINLILPDQPTAEELTAYLETVKDKVKGRIVLAGRARVVPITITPPVKRHPDDVIKERYDPANPQAGRGRGRGRGRGPQRPGALTNAQITRRLDEFLLGHRAKVRVNDAGRDHGQIIAFENETYAIEKAIPTVVLRNEDYGRIARLLAGGVSVELEFNIVNRIHPEGRTAYNAVAEIPGTGKRDEVIMIGGHLDSWHSATGATDNAIGCAIMMEAARILKATGAELRRDVRVALWSGEEQGLLGSQAYVKEHFGSFENPKPEWHKLVAYLNIDTGTGRLRGASVFGPSAAAETLREILAPFQDLGVFGAAASTSRAIGGTDHTSFNNAGLPGIGFQQDPIEYGTHTHHTNLDTYERVIAEDVMQAAVVVASTVYHLANRDEMLPRFAPGEMPKPPAPRGGQ